MSISFREIADQVDAFDAEIDRVNEQRKEFWADIREAIPARDVKALKAAIKARRKRKADRDGEEAYESRVAEILGEIETGTDLATRARAPREPSTFLEALDRAGLSFEQIDLSTGEITEPASVPSETEAGQDEDAERRRPSFEGAMYDSSSVAPPINPEAKATEVETGNAGGMDAAVRHNNDRSVLQVGSSAGRTADLQPGGGIAGHLSQPIAEVPPLSSSDDPGPIPDFLRRVA